MKLTIELVPRTCWYANVRSNVTIKEWNNIRKQVYSQAKQKCEICNAKCTKLECHEIWEYNDKLFIQKLTKMIALCAKCHMVKHIGLAQSKGNLEKALEHLANVNDIGLEDARLYAEVEFEVWSRRSNHKWTLDLSALESYLKEQ